MGANLHALAVQARLLTFRTNMSLFPVMAPFFCGAKPATIPLSLFLGLCTGFFICFVIDWVNRTVHDRQNLKRFGLGIAGTLILLSSFVFAYGVGYVEKVWKDGPEDRLTLVEGISFLVWFVGCILLHAVAWRVSKSMRVSLRHSTAVKKRQHTFFGESILDSGRNLETKRTMDLEDEEDTEQCTSSFDEDDAPPFDEELSTSSPHPESVGVGESAAKQGVDTVKTEVPPDGVRNEVAASDGATKGVELSGTTAKAEQPQKADPMIEDATDVDELDSTCHVVNIVCCDLICGKGGKTRSLPYKAYNIFSWIIWCLLLLASLALIFILVGAQEQEKVVRKNLPLVKEILYANQNVNEMCAFDDRGNGTVSEKVERTQRTFPSPESAHESGYKILHCGACGACSPWHNLRTQYATRKMLGQVSLECAKKTLLGGTFEDLVACTMDKTGFHEQCAQCWATDYQCTRKNCGLIGIRAFMINSVTNLQVGADEITPATCEEAMCEATEITGSQGFVECSGASRRRMNIISTIQRSAEEQCKMVDVPDWSEFFGPSTGKALAPLAE